MSDPTDQGNILHEADVEASVREDLENEGQVGYTNPAITAASGAHALNATFSDTEVEAALNLLGTKINAIITALEANGILVEN